MKYYEISNARQSCEPATAPGRSIDGRMDGWMDGYIFINIVKTTTNNFINTISIFPFLSLLARVERSSSVSLLLADAPADLLRPALTEAEEEHAENN